MCISLISFHSRRFLLCSLWRPRRPSHQTSSWQPGILRRWSCGVEQSADWYSICTNSLYFQESTQDSFVFTVIFCTLSFINLIRVAYVVRRPCRDFTDMLRRHINCRIIIIIIIILWSHKSCTSADVNMQCTVWQVVMVTSTNTQPEEYGVMPNCMRLELVRARSGAWLLVAASMLNMNKLWTEETGVSWC